MSEEIGPQVNQVEFGNRFGCHGQVFPGAEAALDAAVEKAAPRIRQVLVDEGVPLI